MKRSLVCLIFACVSLSPAQQVSFRLGDSGNVQHRVTFSTTGEGLPGNLFAPGGERWLGAAILPSNPAERHLALILLIMFLVGFAMACREVVSWWKARMTQYEPPPLTKLITYIRDSDRRWHATQILRFPLPQLREIPGRLQASVQSVDVDEDDRPKAA